MRHRAIKLKLARVGFEGLRMYTLYGERIEYQIYWRFVNFDKKQKKRKKTTTNTTKNKGKKKKTTTTTMEH